MTNGLRFATGVLVAWQQGGWVYGPRPERACGLGDADGDAAVRRVAAELWGEGNVAASGERAVGRGRVFWGKPLAAVLAQAGLQPDFTYTARSADPAIHYLHRRVGQSDVYFVANWGGDGNPGKGVKAHGSAKHASQLAG